MEHSLPGSLSHLIGSREPKPAVCEAQSTSPPHSCHAATYCIKTLSASKSAGCPLHTCFELCPVAIASAAQGVRVLVLTNVTGAELAAEAAEGAEHCEIWRHFPDRHVVVEGFPRPLLGELRYAMAPFLAYEWLGEGRGKRGGGGEGEGGGAPFKWLLYGDDDTMWFQAGVAALVAPLDPQQPWFLTGACSVGACAWAVVGQVLRAFPLLRCPTGVARGQAQLQCPFEVGVAWQ